MGGTNLGLFKVQSPQVVLLRVPDTVQKNDCYRFGGNVLLDDAALVTDIF